jgi:hypothetical protein
MLLTAARRAAYARARDAKKRREQAALKSPRQATSGPQIALSGKGLSGNPVLDETPIAVSAEARERAFQRWQEECAAIRLGTAPGMRSDRP